MYKQITTAISKPCQLKLKSFRSLVLTSVTTRYLYFHHTGRLFHHCQLCNNYIQILFMYLYLIMYLHVFLCSMLPLAHYLPYVNTIKNKYKIYITKFPSAYFLNFSEMLLSKLQVFSRHSRISWRCLVSLHLIVSYLNSLFGPREPRRFAALNCTLCRGKNETLAAHILHVFLTSARFASDRN